MRNERGTMYNRVKWGLVIRGVLGIALGIYIFARPFASVAALALVIAIWALGDGIVNMVHAFEIRPVMKHWWAMLLYGIVGVVFGLAAFYYYPALSLAFAVVWVSLLLLTTGILGLYVALQERTLGGSWGWPLVFAVISVMAGAYAVTRPDITLAGLIGVIAMFGIVGGVALLMAAVRMQSLQGTFRQAAGTGD